MRSRVVAGLLAGFLVIVCARADAERRSGYDFMTAALRAMQDDETSNPGLLWVGEGETLWSTQTAPADRSCASCHGDAATSMRGVAARYPAFDERTGKPITLAGRIDACRVRHQRATSLGVEAVLGTLA